ncbi:PfkB family carbohydrate kinase [Flavobacterium sp.]|uniref:PfkB family carbohydrate kinase n=1 Tax=Flavobacterium sp. TaxID=239 RepID=UPI00286CC511|nr:PfkB family carbohydrate kinase [Flavobacterium sp.]
MAKSVLCIGAALIDELFFCENAIVRSSSNPAQCSISIGGVISNIVQHLALLDVKTSLITALGNDNDADFIKKNLDKLGIELNESISVDEPTGKYVSISNTNGELYVAACHDISSKYITVPFLKTKEDYIKKFDLIVIDTNLETNTIQWLIDFSKINNKKLIIEPVSVTKASKLSNLILDGVFMLTPNEEELVSIANGDSGNFIQLVENLLKRGVEKVWVRKGKNGSEVHTLKKTINLAVPRIQIIDSTGAGDAALSGWIFGYINDENEATSLELGHTLALEILKIKGTIDYRINKENLYKIKSTYYNE